MSNETNFTPAKLTTLKHYRRHLANCVDTIIDVGVCNGTPDLYEAFPNKDFILIEPQVDGESRLRSKPRKYKFLQIGLGAEQSTLTLNLMHARSSFLERTEMTKTQTMRDSESQTVEVPVDTLDNVIKTENIVGNIGLKIDTEGFELEVIKGLNEMAGRVQFVICEASIRKRFVESYLFSDLVVELHARGFYFYNFLHELVPYPRFYDAIFLRRDNPLFD